MSNSTLPKPVSYSPRICFSIEYYKSDEDARRVADAIRARKAERYNGGINDGSLCGRDPMWDYDHKELGRLYAVTRGV